MNKNTKPLTENYPEDPRDLLRILNLKALSEENRYYIGRLLEKYMSSERPDAEVDRTKNQVRRVVFEIMNQPEKARKMTDFLLRKEEDRALELLVNEMRTEPEQRELDFYLRDISSTESGVTLSDILLELRGRLEGIFESEELRQTLIETFGEKTKQEWWGMVQQEDWYQNLPHSSKRFLSGTTFDIRISVCQKIRQLLRHNDSLLDIKHLQGIKNYFRMRVNDVRVIFSAENGKRLVRAVLPRDMAYSHRVSY